MKTELTDTKVYESGAPVDSWPTNKTEQDSTKAQQTWAEAIGKGFDAKKLLNDTYHELEKALLYSAKEAIQEKDYNFSVRICELGTYLRTSVNHKVVAK